MVSVTVATIPHAEPVGEEPCSGATEAAGDSYLPPLGLAEPVGEESSSGATEVAGDPWSPPLGLADSTVTVRVVVERDVVVVVGSASAPLAEVTALLFPSMSDDTALPDSLVA